MRRIVVAAKAGTDQPWLAQAAAELAEQTGAAVSVVSLDGLDVEALSPTPRSEFRELAETTVNSILERLRAAGVEAEGDVRSGLVTPGILLYAEEKDADVIVCGASTKGRVARRVLGSVPVELIQRARRPVLVITPVVGRSRRVATAPKSESRKGLFATKPIDVLVAETEEKETQLKRAVGALDLTALGLGAIIGTGIFVIIGEAITTSGPSIVLAFMIAGVTCIFSALAFAELASAIPVSGSAYTYSYATLGELAAWIIGWDLILEYGVSIAAVAVGWGAYLNELLDSLFGLSLPDSIANPPGEEGGKVNIPAAFLVLAVTAVLMIGVRESARTNTIMVFFKLAVLLLFLVLGVTAFNSDNFSPFFVEGEGIAGTMTAATLIFFAYIGFDAVSTSSEEVKEPKRDLPRAIIGSLLIATTLYILVALVATGRAAVRPAQGPGRAAGRGAQRGRGHGVGRGDHLLRRARGDHQRRAHAALRPVAHPVRDEPRRADAAAASRRSTRAPARR